MTDQEMFKLANLNWALLLIFFIADAMMDALTYKHFHMGVAIFLAGVATLLFMVFFYVWLVPIK